MPLDIDIQKNISGRHTGTVTLKLSGSLDTATAPQLEQALAQGVASNTSDLVVDLANLKFISSAGIRVFSSARKTMKERGGQASFVNVPPQIQEVFQIIKALPGVSIFESVEELDQYLTARQKAVNPNL